MEYPSAAAFRSAGYENIDTNSTYVGGLVRQHGNVSFSRVFEAGHSVSAYQPETVYQIFKRAIFGRDVATGETEIGSGGNYSSVGPSSCRDVKNKLRESPDHVCYLRSAALTCSDEQLQALQNGTAKVQNSIVISPSFGKEGTNNGTNSSSGTGNGAPGGSTKSAGSQMAPMKVLGLLVPLGLTCLSMFM